MIHRVDADLSPSVRQGCSVLILAEGSAELSIKPGDDGNACRAGCLRAEHNAISPENGRDGLHANSILRNRHTKEGQRRSLNSLQPRPRVSVKRTGVQPSRTIASRPAPLFSELFNSSYGEPPVCCVNSGQGEAANGPFVMDRTSSKQTVGRFPVSRQPPPGVDQDPRPPCRIKPGASSRSHPLLRPGHRQGTSPGQRRGVNVQPARSARRASRARRAM